MTERKRRKKVWLMVDDYGEFSTDIYLDREDAEASFSRFVVRGNVMGIRVVPAILEYEVPKRGKK